MLDQVHSAPRRIEVGRQQRIFIPVLCARKTLCLGLIVAMTALPMRSLQAEPVQPRIPQRADLALKLQQLGVAPEEASKRVQAMTDEEVFSIAQGLPDAPAGEGLACFACFAKLLILAIPVAAIGYVLFNLLSGKKPEQAGAEQPKPAAPEAGK
jgi:hypothetical protein